MMMLLHLGSIIICITVLGGCSNCSEEFGELVGKKDEMILKHLVENEVVQFYDLL